MDKREQEGERKLHPTRQRPGAGDRRSAAAVIAPPEPRAPREVTITEGITIRELAEKLDVRAKDLLKTLLRSGSFRQHQPGAGCAHGDHACGNV